MKTFLTLILAILISLLLTGSLTAAPSVSPAAQAINAFGIDLLRATSNTNANTLLSPYSIQSALAMTYAGAAGATRDEMKKVLHFPADDSALHDSFAQLRGQLAAGTTESAISPEARKKYGEIILPVGINPTNREETPRPLVLNVANRLYAQRGYQFKTNFFTLLKQKYGTSLVPVDFKRFAPAITTDINEWVEQQTEKRIRDLIPSGALNKDSRLVLVNALYFKATWAEAFSKESTQPEPFKIRGGLPEKVPTMIQKADFGYMRFPKGQVVTMPYNTAFQFVILLPDDDLGLAELQRKLTPEFLQQCTSLKDKEVLLHLPKFKFEPDSLKRSLTGRATG